MQPCFTTDDPSVQHLRHDAAVGGRLRAAHVGADPRLAHGRRPRGVDPHRRRVGRLQVVR